MERISNIKKAQLILQREGWTTLLKRFIFKAFSCKYLSMNLFEHSLSGSLLSLISRFEIKIYLITKDDTRYFEDYLAYELAVPEGKTLELLGRGYICLIAQTQGRTVGTMWVAFESFFVDELDLEILLSSTDAYMFWVSIHHKMRGQRIILLLLAKLRQYLRERGIQVLYSVVATTNLPMHNAIKRGSENPILRARIDLLQLSFWKRHFVKVINNTDHRLKILFSARKAIQL